MGLARPLSRLARASRPTPYRALRRLETRVTPRELATGSTAETGVPVKAFPVPGRLAGSHPIQSVWLHRLAGLTARVSSGRPAISGVNSWKLVETVHQTCPPIDPR